jgi:hypothetical protein
MKYFALNNDSSHHASDGVITNQENRQRTQFRFGGIVNDHGGVLAFRNSHFLFHFIKTKDGVATIIVSTLTTIPPIAPSGSTLAPHHLSITRWSHLFSRHSPSETRISQANLRRRRGDFNLSSTHEIRDSPFANSTVPVRCQCSVGQVSDQSFCLSCLPGKHQKKGPCAGQYQNKQSRTAVMRVHPDISLHQRPSSYAIDTSCPQAPPSQHAFDYTNGELHFEQNFGQHCQQKCRVSCLRLNQPVL